MFAESRYVSDCIANRQLPIVFLVALALSVHVGCRSMSSGGWEPIADVSLESRANPMPVPMVPREFVMDEVSDEVDDYFRILREQRIQLVDNILTEGWIDTEPRIGATLLEPWRHDSSRGFELRHATLQTVRRWARVRVIPADGRYLIDVKVYKELEDLVAPEHATVSGKIYRHDNALKDDWLEPDFTPPNLGWIPMGRDFTLEQTLLGHIQERVYQGARVDPHRYDHR